MRFDKKEKASMYASMPACPSVHRQMFLQVGTLTQQPSHPEPTQLPKVPLVHLSTQIILRSRSLKEEDWSMKVSLSFRHCQLTSL